ncbi:ABC transporter substrate-binding protein, partial [Candidatus Marinarcus aquaticus]
FSLFLFFSFIKAENLIVKKRVFYINSYNSGLYWSDGIEKSIKKVFFNSKMPIKFKRAEMDSKRNNDEPYKIKIAQKIKNQIENFKPEVIITSDDNAFKYIILPYFKDSTIPVIFCGINGSSKKYGLPISNVTGMEEVQLVPQTVEILSKYAKGNRVGFLKDDSLTTRIELAYFQKQLNKKMEARLVTSVEEWKKGFIELQNNVDILIIGYGGSIKDWDKNKKEIKDFTLQNTIIPTGTGDGNLIEYALLSLPLKPEEQGEWAANTALRVLKGENIKNIPIVVNKKSNIFINTTLAKKFNIVFPFELIDNAVLIK